ncbi:hypothetical protein, partial [Olavius algarvensis spirochete endosymbiont]|uniref:hypothetical protein n=1 Tax=Olavius algarvensis spirochete endosymbiont TaxID=260710 RepID=UPI001E3B754F
IPVLWPALPKRPPSFFDSWRRWRHPPLYRPVLRRPLFADPTARSSDNTFFPFRFGMLSVVHFSLTMCISLYWPKILLRHVERRIDIDEKRIKLVDSNRSNSSVLPNR